MFRTVSFEDFSILPLRYIRYLLYDVLKQSHIRNARQTLATDASLFLFDSGIIVIKKSFLIYENLEKTWLITVNLLNGWVWFSFEKKERFYAFVEMLPENSEKDPGIIRSMCLLKLTTNSKNWDYHCSIALLSPVYFNPFVFYLFFFYSSNEQFPDSTRTIRRDCLIIYFISTNNYSRSINFDRGAESTVTFAEVISSDRNNKLAETFRYLK